MKKKTYQGVATLVSTLCTQKSQKDTKRELVDSEPVEWNSLFGNAYFGKLTVQN